MTARCVVLAMAVLWMPAFVARADPGMVEAGAGLGLEQLRVGDFVHVVHVSADGRRVESSGFVKAIERDTIAVGRGFWRERIAFSTIRSLSRRGDSLVVGRSSAGGEGPILQVASRVRIRHGGRSDTGTLASVTPDSVVLESGELRVPVARGSIRRIELSLGTRTRAVEGLLVGLGLGGVAVFSAIADDIDDWPIVELKPSPVLEAAALVLPVAGTLIGRRMRHERWRSVSSRKLDIVLLPARGRSLLAARWSF